MLTSHVKFNYNTPSTNISNGLAVGHKYSTDATKGLLSLGSLTLLSADGLKMQPMVAFQYRNPVFGGNYRHDFYGFYRSQELKKTGGFYTYPEGQSQVGTTDNPDAEAWSVWRIVYGNGKVEEYTYQPNQATMLTTNETITGGELNGGIRVQSLCVYDGINTTPLTTSYTYGIGYASYNFAFRNGITKEHTISTFYSQLHGIWNGNRYIKNLQNILALQGMQVEYEDCSISQALVGKVKTYFLNPSRSVAKYDDNQMLAIKEAHVVESGVEKDAINSYSHCRGKVWKVETYNSSNKLVENVINEYWVKPNVSFYLEPEVIPNQAVSCALGVPEQTNPIEDHDNQFKHRYSGFIVPKNTIFTKYGITTKTENLSYITNDDEIPIAIEKTIIKNSNGEKFLTKIKLAHLEKKKDGTDLYPGMAAANILNLQSSIVRYRKAASDNNTDINYGPVNGLNTSYVCDAKGVSFTNTGGCGTWLPYRSYAWNVERNNLGIPVKQYTDFDFENNSTANWVLTNLIEKYDSRGYVVQSTISPNFKSNVSIFRNDNKLQIGVVKGSNIYECGVFTGDYRAGNIPGYWDAENGWEKGDDANVTLSNNSDKIHFGQNVIHVVNDYAAGRNNRVYAGKSYVMSAWVKVEEGTLFMAAGYHMRDVSDDNPWPIPGGTMQSPGLEPDKISMTAAQCNGEWKLMKLVIPASKTKSMIDNKKEYYARAWVGNKGDFGNGDGVKAYIDDIRFLPSDAIAMTTYYENLWNQPILTVDANNNPGNKITYDKFGRVSELKKINKANPSITTPIQKKEYFLMGQN